MECFMQTQRTESYLFEIKCPKCGAEQSVNASLDLELVPLDDEERDYYLSEGWDKNITMIAGVAHAWVGVKDAPPAPNTCSQCGHHEEDIFERECLMATVTDCGFE